MFVPVVGAEDAATCVRPANESVQERFEHKLMNEPYLLRKQLRKGRTNNKKEKEKTPNKRRKRSNGDENC